MSKVYNIDLNGRVSKDDLPVLIGKAGRNMKQCIKNMYDKGCADPNFKFVDGDGDNVLVSFNYSSDEQLELMKSEVEEYLKYWEGNKDNFRPQSNSIPRNRPPRVKSFNNNMLVDIKREDVSSFIGDGGIHIKSLIEKLNTELCLENKIQLHVKYEDDLVYMQVTLFPPHAFMKVYLSVENCISDFVDSFNKLV